jgi:hypothetical protein
MSGAEFVKPAHDRENADEQRDSVEEYRGQQPKDHSFAPTVKMASSEVNLGARLTNFLNVHAAMVRFASLRSAL